MAIVDAENFPTAVSPDGQGGFIFKPQAFKFVWGKDGRYWNIPTQIGSPAELIQVCWLEVTSSTEDLEPGGKYELFFKVSLTGNAFGWENNPVFLMAKIGKKGKYIWKKIFLTERGVNSGQLFTIPKDQDKLVIEVPPDSNDKKLYFGLYEVWSGKWKGGLQIHEAILIKENIFPSEEWGGAKTDAKVILPIQCINGVAVTPRRFRHSTR